MYHNLSNMGTGHSKKYQLEDIETGRKGLNQITKLERLINS